MPLYEHVFLARQDISAQQVTRLVEEYEGIVKNLGGTFERTESWGLRTLAFKIKKNRKAHYTLIQINAPHTAVAEMERQMRINESVIRYLTLKVDKLDENPSIIIQKRDRDERRRREREERIDHVVSEDSSGEIEKSIDSDAPTTLADTVEAIDSTTSPDLDQLVEQIESQAPEESAEPEQTSKKSEQTDQTESTEQPTDQAKPTENLESTEENKKVEKEGAGE